MSKSKYINNPDINQIKDCILTFLFAWKKYFSDNGVSDFAPGIGFRSIDNETTGNQLISWEVYSDGNSKINKCYDLSWWKIIIELMMFPPKNSPPLNDSPSRPRLARTSGGMVESQRVRTMLRGCNITATLSSLHPVPSFNSINDPSILETSLKKFFSDTSYQLFLQIIASCELPKFDHQGRTFKETYQLNAKIKSGAFATVCKGRNRFTGHPCAIKCIARNTLKPFEEIDILNEVSIMSTLSHPSIVPLIDFFSQPDCYLIVMELCEGGDLFDRIGKRVNTQVGAIDNVKKPGYSERDARDLCATILEALRYCHEEKCIAHCDLKPRNLLLQSIDDDKNIKLADFGFATHVTGPKSITKRCGTPFFVAPEILKKKPYDESADMWSLGIIIYLLLGGTMPFIGRNHNELFSAIVEGKYSFPDQYWANVSPDAKELIHNLLQVNPDHRWTARQALQCRWFQKLAGEELAQNDLSKSARELKFFNARLKFKAAVIGVALIQGWERRKTKKENDNDLMSVCS